MEGISMYDVIIIGAGPAGLFAAYELITKNKNLKVLLLDKGKKAENRFCPMTKTGKCVNCNPCNILSGYGGAGTFSDGKLNFIPKIGKSDLFKYMSESEAYKLIDETEEMLKKLINEGVKVSLDTNVKIMQDIGIEYMVEHGMTDILDEKGISY